MSGFERSRRLSSRISNVSRTNSATWPAWQHHPRSAEQAPERQTKALTSVTGAFSNLLCVGTASTSQLSQGFTFEGCPIRLQLTMAKHGSARITASPESSCSGVAFSPVQVVRRRQFGRSNQSQPPTSDTPIVLPDHKCRAVLVRCGRRLDLMWFVRLVSGAPWATPPARPT